MSSSECDARNDAVPCYSRTADTAISIFLIIFTVVGVPANLSSCYLFYRQRSKNSNALYFRRVYLVITAVDSISCLALFPIIQALMNGRDSADLLFQRREFCTAWYIVWIVMQQMTIFLVAMLSISRLYLLKYPFRKLQLVVTRIAPLVYGLIVLVVLCILPLATHYTPVNYRIELAICWLTFHQPEESLPNLNFTTAPTTAPSTTESTDFFDTPNPTDIRFMGRMFLKTVIESFFFGLPVIPIFFSLVLSLYYIRQEINHQPDHQNRLLTAARTVVLVTFVYVLFNLPTLAKGIYLTYLYGMSYHHLVSNDTYREFYHFSLGTYSGYGRYGWDYIWMFVYSILPVCKSVLGPPLYIWRMKTFRKSVVVTISTVNRGTGIKGKGYRVLSIKAGKHVTRVDTSRHLLNSRRRLKEAVDV